MKKTQVLFLLFYLLLPARIHAGNSENYFQQNIIYEIKAELDDLNHRIKGSIRITYENKSNQELDTIWFHLWPNAYSGRNTPLCKQLLIDRDTSLYFSKETDLGRITDYQFSVNGSPVDIFKEGANPEIVGLLLNSKLEPGGQIIIETPFNVEVPDARFSRLGRDNYSYNLTQWYPKPAVFDKGGWHCMSYLSRGEFYSEFGDFEVELTVPSNYTVAASGDLVTESERIYLNQLDVETRRKLTDGSKYLSKEVEPIATSPDKKIVRYELKNAHDFAWFASKYYQVMLDTVVLGSGKKIATSVFFGSKRKDLWEDALEYSKSGLLFLSNEIGDYPYESFAVVDGRISAGGGMEYPGITILNTPGSASDLERVLVHELGHNWFYGALASNERDNPWMDEGMNSFYEYRYMSESRKSNDPSTANGITRFLTKALGVGSLSI
ncbi:MAG: M1 family metallopeptidase, partial [Bacteroidota bacterium]